MKSRFRLQRIPCPPAALFELGKGRPEWYREITGFIAEKETYENATLENALNMLAGCIGFVCSVWYELGGSAAPQNQERRRGVFTAQSIFSVKPPCFSLEDNMAFSGRQ